MDVGEIIETYELSPFKKPITRKSPDILKTKDSKKVHEKLRKKLCSKFVFSATQSILDSLKIPATENEIKKRQEFFKNAKCDNEFLKDLRLPRPNWRPEYSIVVVTENDKMYSKLKTLGVPVSLLIQQHDVEELRDYDIVQAIECDKFQMLLEQLDNVITFESIDDIYLERYLQKLSGWQHNIKVLEKHMDVSHLKELLGLIGKSSTDFTAEDVESTLQRINENISEKLKSTSISGSVVFEMLDSGSLPQEIKSHVIEEINFSGLPPEIFQEGIPVKIDYEELERQISLQETSIHLSFAEKLKKNKDKLQRVPAYLRQLEIDILHRDFCSIMSVTPGDFPEFGELKLENCRNLLLKNPEPVSFHLDENNRCSILTGANSGGKTTLIEHIIQVILLGQLGLPIDGKARVPVLNEIFYFAKNKGSMNQGAFETLLNKMASIKNAQNPIILADEIEAITEPGVAADIISASAEFFEKKDFYLVFATHLGKELAGNLPARTRVDGIEAQGLDEKFNLIIKRSPVLGKLAHSTPELIIERLAQKTGDEYFRHLESHIKD